MTLKSAFCVCGICWMMKFVEPDLFDNFMCLRRGNHEM